MCAAPANVLELLGLQASAPSTPTAASFRPRSFSESLRASSSPSALLQLRARLGLRSSPAPSATSACTQDSANADSARASLVGPPTPTAAHTPTAMTSAAQSPPIPTNANANANASASSSWSAGVHCSAEASASASAAMTTEAGASAELEIEASSEQVIYLLRQWLLDSNPLNAGATATATATAGARTLHPIAEAVGPSPLAARPLSSLSSTQLAAELEAASTAIASTEPADSCAFVEVAAPAQTTLAPRLHLGLGRGLGHSPLALPQDSSITAQTAAFLPVDAD